MNENFTPKPVADFLDGKHHFRIPSFQRGYRWDNKQVNDLLCDLLAFVSSSNSVYYLQPIVVRDVSGLTNNDEEGERFPNGTWEVLDGQQRLTTMLLILKNFLPYLSPKKAEQFKHRLYDISYATRSNLDLDNINPDDDIDSYYLFWANTLIQKWMEKESESHPGAFEKIPGTLFNTDGDQKVQFIWYVAQNEETSSQQLSDPEIGAIKVFNRLNKGKIGLTSAELIKALFVLGCNNEDVCHDSDVQKMTMIWDFMENKFYDDAFWYFISGDSAASQTRMDLLFDFVSCKGPRDDSDFAYRWFQQKYDENLSSFIDLWKTVKKVFDELVHWFEDVNLYNYVGYLVANGMSPLEIHRAIEKAKNDISEWSEENTYAALVNKIKDLLGLGHEDIESITYANGDKARRVLLLFNIEIYREAGQRFPFDAYKKERCWDIEHVDSQTTNTMQEIGDKLNWIDYVIVALSSDVDEDAKSLKAEGISLKKTLEKDGREIHDNFSNYYGKVVKYYSRGTGYDTEDADKDSLGNLVLLDSVTNRGYQNAPFPYKRHCVIERDKSGKFVPLGTKNVFLKYYSDSAGAALDAIRWHASDKSDYLKELYRVLGKFTEKGMGI